MMSGRTWPVRHPLAETNMITAGYQKLSSMPAAPARLSTRHLEYAAGG